MPSTIPSEELPVRGQSVDMDKVPPLFSASCEHNYLEDPTDQTDYYIAVSCTKCGRGYLKRKH